MEEGCTEDVRRRRRRSGSSKRRRRRRRRRRRKQRRESDGSGTSAPLSFRWSHAPYPVMFLVCSNTQNPFRYSLGTKGRVDEGKNFLSF
jgi:hypothetical protein